MGSLWTSIIGVMLRLPPMKVKWCEKEVNVRPSPVQFPGWRIAITGRPSSWGEVPILGSVSERLWLIIRIQCMMNRVYPDGCIECCGESVPPLQRIETIRIAVSTVMDGWMAILLRRQKFSKINLWTTLVTWFVNGSQQSWYTWHLGSHLSNLDN